MNTLLSLAVKNLNVLTSINKNQQLVLSGSRKLNIQDDYVQLENVSEIENGIHFTFHQILSTLSFLNFEHADKLIEIMDEAIDNIFKNEKLNELMEGDSEILEIVNNIDEILDAYKESVFYKSPFYDFQRKLYRNIDFVKATLMNAVKKEVGIRQVFRYYITKNMSTGEVDPNLSYSTSDEEIYSEEEEDISGLKKE